MDVIIDGRNHLKIEKMWAFVSVDEKGDEGLCAFLSPTGWVPMVAADEKMVEILRPKAQELALKSKRPIKLVRFSNREDVEVIGTVPIH